MRVLKCLINVSCVSAGIQEKSNTVRCEKQSKEQNVSVLPQGQNDETIRQDRGKFLSFLFFIFFFFFFFSM